MTAPSGASTPGTVSAPTARSSTNSSAVRAATATNNCRTGLPACPRYNISGGINNGSWKGVNIAGLGVVGVVRAKYTLGDIHRPDNPATAVLIVDSRATAEQRSALVAFAKNQAPDLLTNVVQVKSAPIDLVVANGNVHGGAARLTAGSLAEIATRRMT